MIVLEEVENKNVILKEGMAFLEEIFGSVLLVKVARDEIGGSLEDLRFTCSLLRAVVTSLLTYHRILSII